MSKIMNKRFYIVVPFSPLSEQAKGTMAKFKDIFRPATVIKLKEERFLRHKDEIYKLMENVMSGLSSAGLQSVQLDTQGLIELYYNSYNPGTSGNQKMVDVSQLRIAEDF